MTFKQGDLYQHCWGGKLLLLLGLFFLAEIIFSSWRAGDPHQNVRISEFLKAGQKQYTIDGQDKTHQILRKFCLGQNEKRGSSELSLLPVDDESMDQLFSRFIDQHPYFGNNSTFHTSGFEIEQRTLSLGGFETCVLVLALALIGRSDWSDHLMSFSLSYLTCERG